MTSALETEWDYSGRTGRDGQQKKIGKANERKGKVKRGKDEEVNGQGGRGVPRPHTGVTTHSATEAFKRHGRDYRTVSHPHSGTVAYLLNSSETDLRHICLP